MINLRKIAEDEVVFRFDSNEDRREFWGLFIKNRGCHYDNHISDLKNFAILWKCEDGKLHINSNDTHPTRLVIPAWTEVKEKYREKLNVTVGIDIGKISKDISNVIENSVRIMKENEIEMAKRLLESNGYKVEVEYIEPSDEEIIVRINTENKKIDFTTNWKDYGLNKYYIYYDHADESYGYYRKQVCEMLGATYTTQEIAEKIVIELNEKRFERV